MSAYTTNNAALLENSVLIALKSEGIYPRKVEAYLRYEDLLWQVVIVMDNNVRYDCKIDVKNHEYGELHDLIVQLKLSY